MQNSVTLRHPLPIGRHTRRPAVFRVCLGYREMFFLDGDHRGADIVNVDSVLWITQDGDTDDHFLQPGERFRITLPGRVVVQGMWQF